MSSAVLTPVSTMRLGRPAAFAPAMSVSSRSPTTSGVGERAAGQRVVQQRRLRLAGDLGLLVGRRTQRRDHRPVPGQQASLGRQREVDVGRDPERTASDGQRRFGKVGPAGLWRVALHDRDRLVGRTAAPVRVRPRAISAANASVPTMRTAAPGGNWAASRLAALCALVTTSSGSAANPKLDQVLGYLGRAA